MVSIAEAKQQLAFLANRSEHMDIYTAALGIIEKLEVELAAANVTIERLREELPISDVQAFNLARELSDLSMMLARKSAAIRRGMCSMPDTAEHYNSAAFTRIIRQRMTDLK